jgi:hypothetical protein
MLGIHPGDSNGREINLIPWTTPLCRSGDYQWHPSPRHGIISAATSGDRTAAIADRDDSVPKQMGGHRCVS